VSLLVSLLLLLLLLLLLQVVSPFTADGLLGDWEITQRLWEYALRWDADAAAAAAVAAAAA
jgi:hypothetical protein